jgi:pyruvate dehydrogenase (quinone)
MCLWGWPNNSRPRKSTRRAAVDVGVIADVRTTIHALLAMLDQQQVGAHLQQARQHYTKARGDLDALGASGGARANSF